MACQRSDATGCDGRPKADLVGCGYVPYLLGQNSLILSGHSALRSEMPISHSKRAMIVKIVRYGKPWKLWLTAQPSEFPFCAGPQAVISWFRWSRTVNKPSETLRCSYTCMLCSFLISPPLEMLLIAAQALATSLMCWRFWVFYKSRSANSLLNNIPGPPSRSIWSGEKCAKQIMVPAYQL